MAGAAAAPRVVVLDRDGVLNDPVLDPADGRPESPLHAADVRLAAGAAAGCRLLQEHGLTLAVASNQPAAAKGKTTLAQLREVHDRLVELLAAEGVTIGVWRYCHHHPEATDPALRGPCDCRKPQPGMLLEILAELGADAADAWMVGDTSADVGAGRAAGMRVALVEHPGSGHRRQDADAPDLTARDLLGAAGEIVALVQ